MTKNVPAHGDVLWAAVEVWIGCQVIVTISEVRRVEDGQSGVDVSGQRVVFTNVISIQDLRNQIRRPSDYESL